MANTIEYIFSLRDQVSAKLGTITATSDKTEAALLGVQEKVRTVDAVCRDTGKTIGTLKMRIDALQAEREWIPADNLPAIKEYNREINRLTDELERLETAAGGGKFKKWASEAFDAIPGAGLLKNPLVTGVTAIGAAGMAGMNFDEAMAQVNITAQLDEAGLDDLKKRLKQIAADNKTDIQVVPVGFEQINSQVNDVDLSLQILDAALKGSKAGFTDLDTVSAALAQTLSIVGKENTTAAEVLDTFFAAKRVGAGEFADFARYMPNLIAGADSLGIAYKEVAGTFAYMTGKGQSAERAATLMENAFSVMGRVDVRKKLSEAGVDVFDDTGKIRGIVDIFSDLEKVLGSLSDEEKSSMLEQFGLVDKEAKSAFAVLTSDIGKLEESMRDVVGATGETDAALAFSRNSMQQATEVWNQFKNIGTEVGELMLPAISAGLTVCGAVLSGVSAVLDVVVGFFSGWFTLLQEGNPIVVGLTTTLGLLTAAVALNHAWTQRAVVLAGIKKLADIAQTAATSGLTVAQWALNAAFYASPLGWIALAVGAVVAVVTVCWQKFEGFRRTILGVWEVVKEFGRTLLDSIVKPFKQVLSGIGGVCSAIVSLLKGNFKEAATLAKDGFKDIGEGVLGANPASVLTNTVQNGNYTEAWERGKQAGSDSWAASQAGKDADAANQLMPEVPEALTAPAANVPDFGALMAKSGNVHTSVPSTAAQPKVLRLDDGPIVQDLNETSDYTAITRKLEPVSRPAGASPNAGQSVPEAGGMGLPGLNQSQLPQVDDTTQEYGNGETNYLADIMLNVRKIAAAVAFPVALSLAPLNANAGNDRPLDLNITTTETLVPDIAVPAPEVPEIPAPSVAVNDTVKVPEIAAPAVEVPEAAVPLVDVAGPAVTVPDIAVPAPQVPEIPAPSVAVNDTVNVPDMVAPVVEVPEAAAPLVNVASPAVTVPDIAVPAPQVPEIPAPSVAVNDTVNVPDMVAPAVEVPEAAAPVVNVPSPAVTVPDIAVPMPQVPDIPTPSISDAYNVENIRETNNTFTSDSSRTYNNSRRTVQVGKVCDEVVIHVANTDRKGGDAIRREIMNILNELGEG